ncbi:hypothetical protein F5B20DRAFT_597131 [Whalleya microplaca]|nr:hypothetical protein F5B20DRAFT_597131 [Whalleya microplaca]
MAQQDARQNMDSLTSDEYAPSQPDEYARENGLSIDCQVGVLSLLYHFQKSNPGLDGLIDDSSLPQLHLPLLVSRHEQMDVPKGSAELLEKVVPFTTRDDPVFKSVPQLTPFKLAKLKLESPLLESDPEYDCRKLARTVQSRRDARIDAHVKGIPPEPLNRSNDESLDFPESAHQYRQEIATAIRVEKIDIPKDTLRYLACALRDYWTQHEQRSLSEESLRESILTPPLSPIVIDDDQFVPDEQVCQVPMLSDPSSLLEADLNAAEAEVLGQDSPRMNSSPQHTDILSVSPLAEAPLLSPKLPRIGSLKVEAPLTPLDSLSPSGMAIDFLEISSGVDMDQVLTKELDLSSAELNKDDSRISSDELFSMLEETATSVMRDIQQESLQAADALARRDIPIMDFMIPEPDWLHAPLDAASQFSWIWKTYNIFTFSPWPKNSEAERQQLCWCPIPSSAAKISVQELIEDNKNLKVFIESTDSANVPTSADYVWKQPGLDILREKEVEENQLEPASIQRDDKSLASLLRKRRLAYNDTDLDPDRLPSNSLSPIDLIQPPESTSAVPHQVTHKKPNQFPSLLVGCSEASATSTLLSNYIEFRTTKRQKSTRSSFFPVPTDRPVQAEAEPVPDETEDSTQSKTLVTPECQHGKSPASFAPFPPLNPSSARTKIIKALALPRGIFSRLEKLYANAEIIERDFDRWNNLIWDRNSVSRSAAVSPLAAEADVIVSPATGIVVTTLLKAIQKPLPGHKGQAVIRERIRAVSLRYERLIVLVSEGNGVDERVRDLTPSDCAGYADFAGFVSGLDTNAQAYYVGGGEETLVRWMVSFLQRYAPEAAEFQDILIQDETQWELFLRRAGMNTYAAQAILGRLKAPDGVPEDERYRFGLPAFVRMTPVERMQNFRGLMGGEKVLNRVSWMLETRWS